jgi:hypothetical protein
MDNFQKPGDENRTEMQKDLVKAHPGYHKIEAEPLFTKHDSNYYKAAGIEVDKKFDNSNDYIKPGLTKPKVNTDKEQEAAEGYQRTAGGTDNSSDGVSESEKTFEGNISTFDSFISSEKVDELYMGPGNPAFDAGKKMHDEEEKKEPVKEGEDEDMGNMEHAIKSAKGRPNSCRKFLDDLLKRVEENGGNAVNMESLKEVANHIDDYHVDNVPSVGEPGFYTNELVEEFKKFVRKFAEEEVKHNNINKHTEEGASFPGESKDPEMEAEGAGFPGE